MNLQDTFYLVAIIFFISSIAGVIYIVYMLMKLKQSVDKLSDKAKVTAETLALTGYGLKASILKSFLSFLGGKGGE